MKFYTLMYLDTENKSLAWNGIHGNFLEQMTIFKKCAMNLSASLMAVSAEYKLNVITNDRSFFTETSDIIDVIEIEFKLKLPKDIWFYSAHHKIEIYKWLSENINEYSFLIDSDSLCINKMPPNLQYCINKNIPVYYDITDQNYPIHGRDLIIKDKQALDLSCGLGNWMGGEFIGGNRGFYKDLYQQVEMLLPKYIDKYKSLHHRGDEMLTSVATENLMKKYLIVDAGRFGAIGRYWSVYPQYCQQLFGAYKDKFILHLPADKMYIASLKIDDKTNLIIDYETYLRGKHIDIDPEVFKVAKGGPLSLLRIKMKNLFR